MLPSHQNPRFLQYGYPLLCILSGLIVAQVIATLQVYISNIELQAGLRLIHNTGYLMIPNQTIMNHLHEPGPAIYGGLFFTLSIGCGLSMAAFGASWAWIQIFSARKFILLLLVISWVLSLLMINWHGFTPFVSACFFFVPLTVFLITWKLAPHPRTERFRVFKIIHPGFIIILGFLWTWQMGGDVFMNIRDNLLLSTPMGQKLNTFYYRYTFYPAEVLKPLDQRTLKTCLIAWKENGFKKEMLEKKLLEQDYLPLENADQADLALHIENEEIFMRSRGKTVMITTTADLLSMESACLKEYSQKTDRYGFFRKCVFYSLLAGLPAFLYLFLFILVRSSAALFFRLDVSNLIASLICFCAGVALLTAITPGNQEKWKGKTLDEMLGSGAQQERVTALKKVLGNKAEITAFPAYRKFLQSPHIPDRYWFTKTLAFSQGPETLKDLLTLLNDPSPNVVSMAYWSLGRGGNRSAIPEILKRIQSSHDWYNQWYAYNALKDLGWTQSRPAKISHRRTPTDVDEDL